MAKILGIGIATVDVINLLDGYPEEDSEVRAFAQTIERGGNVTNTLVVLSQLGNQCHWAGVMAEDPASQVIRGDLDRYRVDYSCCPRVTGGKTPTSYIALNRETGSRTIIHYRDLPEYGFNDFKGLDLTPYQWLHFEGRAVAEMAKMLAHAHRRVPQVPRSLEIEKPRPGIEQLFDASELLLFSRVYAQSQGAESAVAFLQQRAQRYPGIELVCSWGDQGAWCIDGMGELHHHPASKVQVMDSIGAGDTFNAGYIDQRCRGVPPQQALAFACRLAGRKCAQQGFAGLAEKVVEWKIR